VGWHIDEREYQRHEARRGRRFAYETLDPARTALVVVDMVPFFVHDLPRVRDVVEPINALAGALRAAGGVVAWVVPAVAPPGPWAVGFYGPVIAARYAASGSPGTSGGPPVPAPGLDRHGDDLLVEKSATSAFFPGRSELPDRLGERGVDTVLITGTTTSVCCASSARDAATLGFRVIFVADATADVSEDAHNATLRTVYRSFGDVRPVAEVRSLLAPP
jgi:nicotinamidase-related amidase